MTESLQVQIEKLHITIDGLEAQRSLLGDAIVDPALAALRAQLAGLEEQLAAQSFPFEERRMITILFMDIVGSTSMAEKLDPEEWRQIVSKVHSTLGEAIVAHHGVIAQYLGDGLLAFFGSKEASEHDPENAVRAALDGQANVANLRVPEKVQLRAGIHTGLVVVGELGEASHKEFTASGDAVNLAARLQSAAPPDGILISHDTYRYIRGVFDMTPRPPLTVKGKSEPLQTYLVRRAKPRPFRSLARGVAGVETRTIGREVEIETLQAAYLRAYERHSLVWAQLLSEPGVGKSRLVMDLGEWMDLRDETYLLLRARAFPDDTNQPFALIRRLWFDRFQIAEDAPLEQAEGKWVERFKEFSGQVDGEESAHALGLLVGLQFHDSPFLGAMRSDPIKVKERALVASRELLMALRRQYPVVVLLEDLQWADAASWDYLMDVFLTESAGEPRSDQLNGLFILGAARLEWCPPEKLIALFSTSLPGEKDFEKYGILVNLAPLTVQASRQLAQELLQRVDDIPEQVIDLLVERSEGVPYFTEEIINWFVDHGILDTHAEEWHFLPEKLKEQLLPATLQHLLLTRLSSLSQPERAALQRGAIFGRRFWTRGVEALGVPAGTEVLGHLQPRGFVDVQPESAFQGDTEWSFRHNLLQKVTYESVLKRERAALHKVAAAWLEQQARQAGRMDEFAGLLGDHYERAGELNVAADWYMRAGKRAMGQGAPREAKGFYTRALDLLPPMDHERRWQALLGREEVLTLLSDVELWKIDITALLELAHTFDDESYLAEVYFRQAAFSWTNGDRPVAAQAAQEALTSARRCGNEAIAAKALALTGVVELLVTGETTTAIEHLEEALHNARLQEDKSVLANVLYRASYCYSETGDISRFIPLQVEQIELDRSLGNRSQEAAGLNNLGINYFGMGMYKQARSLLEQSRAIAEALGAHRMVAYSLMNLAEVYLSTSDLRKALQCAEQALHEMSTTQNTVGKISILNDYGNVLLAMNDIPGATRYLTEAREIALNQEMAGRACEAEAGLAACALMQGQLDQARLYIHNVWDYLKEHGWIGMGNVGRVYRFCAETFDALGEVDNLSTFVERARQEYIELADKINVPAWRQSFLETPDCRVIMEMWERLKL